MYHTVTIGKAQMELEKENLLHTITTDEAFSFLGILFVGGFVVWIVEGSANMLVSAVLTTVIIMVANHRSPPPTLG